MTRTIISALMLMLLTYSSASFAHSDHHHPPKKPVTEDTAKAKAKESVSKLIKQKKIDRSWVKAELVSIEKKKFGGKMEWVAIFLNEKVKEKTKRKLYIFMKLSGDFLAANYTGK